MLTTEIQRESRIGENPTYGLVGEVKPTRRRRGGFTLIELLVIFAIIVILMSLLFPALKKAKEKAIGIECLNNLNNLGVAFHEYVNDFDGYGPVILYDSTGGWKKWYSEIGIWPYIFPRNNKVYNNINGTIFNCPQEPFGFGEWWSSQRDHYGRIYCYNSGLIDPNGIPYNIAPRLGSLRNSSISLLLYEILYLPGDGTYQFSTQNCGIYSPTVYPLPNHHNNGTNVLFCDGHVEWKGRNSWPTGKNCEFWLGVY